jgi:hypothetical protein
MSEKILTKVEWDKFAKGQTLKDAALIKALVALDKADKLPAADQLKALDEVEKQVDALLKAHKADKALAKQLTDMDKAVSKWRTEADHALKAEAKDAAKEASKEAASKGKSEDAEEDDEPASALLDPKKLLAQLMLCKRDPDRTVNFGFVDGKDKQDAVLALSPKVGGKRLFASLQQATGAKTGAYGSVWVVGTELMLQLDKPLSGLIKKIRGPIKACGFRISKAILWNADGTVFEQEEEIDGADQAPDTTALPTRLAALAARAALALKAQHPESTKIRAVEGFARDKLQAGDLKGTTSALDMLEKLLGAATTDAKAAQASTAAAKPTADAKATATAQPAKSIVALQTSRLDWDGLRKRVQQQLQALEAALLKAVQTHNADESLEDEYDEAGVATNVRKIYGLLDKLDERLIDKLDEALNASGAQRDALNAQAAGIVKEYQAFVDADPLIAEIDSNGFISTSIRGEVQRTLTKLASQL